MSRRTALLLFGYVLFLAASTAFRFLYFGSPLPNTFYAKVGGASFFLPTLPVLCVLLVRGAIVAHRHDTARARFAQLGVGVCFVWFVFGVIMGVLALVASALASWPNPRGSWRRPVRTVALALFLAGSAGVLIHETQRAEVETTGNADT